MTTLEAPVGVAIGDLYQCDCPACGSQIYDLWDLGVALIPGQEILAPCCGAWLKIAARHGVVLEIKEE